MRFNDLLHLVAFPWKAHGTPPTSGLVAITKMPESHAFSKFSDHFKPLHTPVSPSVGGCTSCAALSPCLPGIWRRSCCHGIARRCRISVEAYAFEGKPKRGNSSLTVSGVTLPQIARCDMTTSRTTSKTAQVQGRFRLPDPPQREPDEMTQYDSLFKTGNSRYLALHLGHPETTLVEADRWIVPDESFNKSRARRPDLLVAFDVYPQAYEASNGYVVSEQGKPPDFVLEIASRRTGRIDVTEKREDYAALGIGEYWRFDETRQYHGARLAGERLVDAEYVAIDIEELPGGGLRGYNAALDLNLRWERGELVFYNPGTGRPSHPGR